MYGLSITTHVDELERQFAAVVSFMRVATKRFETRIIIIK